MAGSYEHLTTVFEQLSNTVTSLHTSLYSPRAALRLCIALALPSCICVCVGVQPLSTKQRIGAVKLGWFSV